MTKPSWQDFGTHDESAYPELWDGVVGAWAPCRGPTGSRLHDHSRRSNWGTLTNMDNATDWVVSDGQYALDIFDNQYVDCDTMQNESLAYPFSMSCWVRNMTSAAGDYSPFAKIQNDDSYAGVMIWINGSTPNAYWAGASRVSATGSFSGLSRWLHLAIAWTGAQAQIIIDGRINATSNVATAPNASASPVSVGRYKATANRSIRGQIDDCVIWRRCLSPNEWRQLYQLGRGGMYQRRRRSRIYIPQVGFQAAWARRQSQIIGGGL